MAYYLFFIGSILFMCKHFLHCTHNIQPKYQIYKSYFDSKKLKKFLHVGICLYTVRLIGNNLKFLRKIGCLSFIFRLLNLYITVFSYIYNNSNFYYLLPIAIHSFWSKALNTIVFNIFFTFSWFKKPIYLQNNLQVIRYAN
ncbi:hypothetical protein P256_00959 [Acinetobacter nectaris CIP 110549]|uniref:Uncharacterized protein n=1 Tax=Acinetobacter nectaris CIP 110549 TaxID=1392540 RepID=V2TR35_9GAMM|nr:hypothetical protein P256_00959 [Acinetobacter nectaris CIP 110549]